MKPSSFINLCFFMLVLLPVPLQAQHYLTGEIRDEHQNPLQNVKIFVPSNKRIFHTGLGGKFGISILQQEDSLVITHEEFDTLSIRVHAGSYQELTLKRADTSEQQVYREMLSFTSGLEVQNRLTTVLGGETYNNLVENDFVNTGTNRKTTWGLKMNKASYSNIRRFVNKGIRVPPDAVRVEEILNYFNLNYREPDRETPFRVESTLTNCIWNKKHQLLMMHISARKAIPADLPPSNIVLLIDVSGSMDMPNKLPLLKESLPFLVDNLRPVDTLSIVVYGGNTGIWLTPTSGNEKDSIKHAIEQLSASGSTPGERALREAYQLAENTYINGGNNRIVLATDGDFNVGETSEEELRRLVLSKRNRGIYLSCIGVGMGNYKESKLETLAKNGNGNFAYIDHINEAEKVLLHEFYQTVYSVTDRTYADISFDSSLIKSYRLIGYDNEKTDKKDFISIPVGGSIGSGFGTSVLFEIVPRDEQIYERSIGKMAIHYVLPLDSTERRSEFMMPGRETAFEDLPQPVRLTAALALFGMKLRQSAYIPDVSWSFVRESILNAYDEHDSMQRELLDIVERVGDYTRRERKKFKKKK